jgi:hypothetical protein
MRKRYAKFRQREGTDQDQGRADTQGNLTASLSCGVIAQRGQDERIRPRWRPGNAVR